MELVRCAVCSAALHMMVCHTAPPCKPGVERYTDYDMTVRFDAVQTSKVEGRLK